MPAALLTHSSRLPLLLRPCSDYPTSTRVAKRQPFTSCLAAHLQFPPPSPQPLHCYTCSFSCTMLHMPRTCSTRHAMIFFIFIYFVPFFRFLLFLATSAAGGGAGAATYIRLKLQSYLSSFITLELQQQLPSQTDSSSSGSSSRRVRFHSCTVEEATLKRDSIFG